MEKNAIKRQPRRNKATTCEEVVNPTKADFLEYAKEHDFVGWKFSPSKVWELSKHGVYLPSRKEARDWKTCIMAWWIAHLPKLRKHEKEQLAAQEERAKIKAAKRAEIRRQRLIEQRKIWKEQHKDYFFAYTDGSCCYEGGYGPGGSAYVVLKDGVPIHEAAVGKDWTTSNRMEMLAIISVLNWLPAHSKVVIRSDSQYSIKIFTREWEAHKNKDLLKLFDEVSSRHDAVEFQWVKGHNGNEWNEYVDQLATEQTDKILDQQKVESYEV